MNDMVREEAQRREAVHANHETSRPLSKDYEYIGLLGEVFFARNIGRSPDMETRPGGDHGKDGEVHLAFTYDVKTARKPYHLIVEKESKTWADIYILLGYDDANDKVYDVGWEWGVRVRNAPTKDFGYGIINHYIPAHQLRPMNDLYLRIRTK